MGGECYAGDGECFSSILKIAAYGAIGVDFELDARGLDDAIGIRGCDAGDRAVLRFEVNHHGAGRWIPSVESIPDTGTVKIFRFIL